MYVTRMRDPPKKMTTGSHQLRDDENGTPHNLDDADEDSNGDREEKFIFNGNDIEQSNIGFGTDPSWFHQQEKLSPSHKCDLLHTGSRGGKLIIVMVGLPGSGKTFMSRKISRFLRWISYRTRVYSLAKYRLEKFGAKNADFFDPENEIHSQTRVR
jgi:hypothetical protein